MTVQNSAISGNTAIMAVAKTETVKPQAAKAETVKTDAAPRRDTFTYSESSRPIGLYKPAPTASESGKSSTSFDTPDMKTETAKTEISKEAVNSESKASETKHEAQKPYAKDTGTSLKKLSLTKQKFKAQLKTADPANRAAIERKLKAIDAQIKKAKLAS